MRPPIQSSDATIENPRLYIRKRVRHCEDLPAVPGSVAAITALLDDVNSSLDELEAFIVSDPCCVARLIQVANSALYGSHPAIMSVRRAILLLGFDALKGIFSNMPLYDSFVRKNTSEIQAINGMCLHSLAVATLSRRIAKDMRRQAIAPDMASCAGLLHDIGRAVLLHLLPEAYSQLLSEAARDPESDLFKAENDIFDVTHVEVGRWFAEAWHLPLPISQTIAMHHRLHPDNRLVMVVKLADYIVNKERLGLVDGHERRTDPGLLLRELGLSTEHLKQYGRFIQSEVDRLQRSNSHAA